MENNGEFEKLIKKDRDLRQAQSWGGNLLGYLEKVKEDPTIAKLAHARLHDLIMKPGVHDIQDSTDPHVKRLYKDESIKILRFLCREFFGIEKTIAQIVRYFHAAASQRRRKPPGALSYGSGRIRKEFARRKASPRPRGNRAYSMPLRAAPCSKNLCTLIPRHLRKEFEKMLGVHIEGDLCPVCRYRLKEEFGGDTKSFRFARLSSRSAPASGIGVVPPVDPNNQDTSVLIGSEDISKLDLYSEGDPRVLELNGALNVGNRGIVEFIEVFKNEIEYLHCMITATQEKVIPAPGRHGLVYVDTVIVAHSNEAEWQKFKADHTNEAILDRIVVVSRCPTTCAFRKR